MSYKDDQRILMTILARKIKSNDSDELTEEANHTPIPMSNSSGAKQWLQTKDWERVELRYWGKHPIPHVSDVNRKLLNTETLALTRIKTSKFAQEYLKIGAQFCFCH